MPKYIANMTRTAPANGSLPASIGAIHVNAGTPGRIEISRVDMSCRSAPNDVMVAYEMWRATAVGVQPGSAPVARPLDPTWRASAALLFQNLQTEPTFDSPGVVLPHENVHQKALFSWQAGAKGEIVIPAVAGAGLAFRVVDVEAPNPTPSPQLDASVYWED